ncbi:hypothetical protein H0H93_000870 [Arthromyces matolae]|nr:hypothetical protein H0H93_000870 [Arthromyces matolae]
MSHIFMKRSLLVASYILLVIAAPAPREPPLPQLSLIDHGVDWVRIGTTHDSGSPGLGPNPPTTSFDHASQPLGESAGALNTFTKRGGINNPHPDWQPQHRASAPDDYQFGRTTDGADIMEAIGLPKITPYLDRLPKNWDSGKWDRLTLEHIATGISLCSETVITSIRDDRNEIRQSNLFPGIPRWRISAWRSDKGDETSGGAKAP